MDMAAGPATLIFTAAKKTIADGSAGDHHRNKKSGQNNHHIYKGVLGELRIPIGAEDHKQTQQAPNNDLQNQSDLVQPFVDHRIPFDFFRGVAPVFHIHAPFIFFRGFHADRLLAPPAYPPKAGKSTHLRLILANSTFGLVENPPLLRYPTPLLRPKFGFIEQLDCGKAPLVGELSAVPTEGFSDPKHL
jgi:hypothetical protein